MFEIMSDWDYRARIRKANRIIKRKMPGKTLEDVHELYKEFCNEWESIQKDESKGIEDTLMCMEKYKYVWKIADLFPPLGDTRSWYGYHEVLQYLSKYEHF